MNLKVISKWQFASSLQLNYWDAEAHVREITSKHPASPQHSEGQGAGTRSLVWHCSCPAWDTS